MTLLLDYFATFLAVAFLDLILLHTKDETLNKT